MSRIEEARKLRSIIEQAIQSADDAMALKAKELHPEWTVGKSYPINFKVQKNNKLYRTLQAHTSQEGWEPENAASLWVQINEIHTGTADDPIPYDGNMALENGKYYIQNYEIYLCNRDTINPVYNNLEELIGLYVIKED